ncbi:Translation initiation factor IF-2, partial [Operophtera brumata]
MWEHIMQLPLFLTFLAARITTNPWQRREMGPYGYYLNRPPSDLQSATTAGLQQLMPLRRAFSDSNILIKEPPKRKRHSKSI